MKAKFRPVIGLEVHVELATKSKMFCGCPAAHFRVKPNTNTCPVCLGLPGALPVANEKAIEDTIKIALALNCKINNESKFDRKQYFYPDLPKGYQISQYDEPLAKQGRFELKSQNSNLKILIRIRRVHLEEDTGKLIHKNIKGEDVSLVDFNRSGVPLVEIVSEPDISSSQEAKEYARSLQNIIRWLGVSDCDMEKGSMRLEANISLQKLQNSKIPNTQNLPDYKVEVKNINSFRFLEKAINYETVRQVKILAEGKLPRQETRGWDEKSGKTTSQRYKETEADYRYFPEPDIPPMEFAPSYINRIKKHIPELPSQIYKRFADKYGVPKQYLGVLTGSKELAEFSESVFKLAQKQGINPKEAAGFIVNTKPGKKVKPKEFLKKIVSGKKSVISNLKIIEELVERAVAESSDAVADYKSGKTQALASIMGKAMQLSKGKADPAVTKKLLEKKLKK